MPGDVVKVSSCVRAMLVCAASSAVLMSGNPAAGRAQATGALAGTIFESETSRPLEGVRVAIAGTDVGATTDRFGQYRLANLPTGEARVRIQLPGYATIVERIPVDAGKITVADFEMAGIINVLDELVVWGAAGPVRRREIGESVAELNAKQIEATGASTITEALPGHVAGAEVVWASGQVGAGASVLLRGLRSATQEYKPLIYVDGVRLANVATPGTTMLGASGLDMIDPSTVDRVEVLRGPAAMMYGTGSVDGVILIYTKKGTIPR
jgi:outer membrane receptor protein involved in Fe transport